jgi:DeoR/GlpR family transcriptional regulator of sugar metabolism
MGLLAENRQQMILERVRLSGRIQVGGLSKELGVTEVTIRRDLSVLQKNGLIKKTYGGAVLTSPPEMNVSVRYRQIRNLAAKRIIGKLAAALIKDGDIIYLEAGSTCYEITPYLAQKKNLTVIVNSLYLMSRLHELTQHHVIITGGHYRADRMDMVGPTAESAIAQLGGFKAFTGADDITIDSGISGSDVVTVSFTKLVLQRASEVILVADHSKFDNPALYKIADIAELDYIVTDEQPSPAWLSACRQKNIKLIYPS